MLYYRPSELNVSGSFNKGWNFRTVLKGESGGTTIFIPASGKRVNNFLNVLSGVGAGCTYWSSAPYNNYQGAGSGMGQYIFYLQYGCDRMEGFAVRPVAEN